MIPFENPLFLIPMLTGIVFVIAGYILLRNPPKEINNLYGYRTKRSMANQKVWDFAQIYSAKEMMKWGGILSFSGVLGFFVVPEPLIGTAIAMAFLFAVTYLLYVNTENAMKDFDGGDTV